MKVLIPTSGLGSRVGEFTNYNNKSLLKVGDKPVISHIIESYPGYDFVITLGHFGDYVKQFLLMAYPNINFEFVEVNPYQGGGSGLLKSISFAQDLLQEPFIFHVCDTILDSTEEAWGTHAHENWMICSSSRVHTDQYRTVLTEGNHITKINEKGAISYTHAYIGIAGIHDYKLFWKYTNLLIEKQGMGEADSSDCHVFQYMLKDKKIKFKEIKNWFDTGNVENLKLAQKKHPALYTVLDKYEEAIYFVEDNVIKFYTDDKVCEDRVHRAEILKGHVPELLDASRNFYKYKLVEGDLLSDVLTKTTMIDLMDWAEKTLWEEISTDSSFFKTKCEEFYQIKTEKRIAKYLGLTQDVDKEENINGIIVPPYSEIKTHIDWTNIISSTPTVFHGDFVLDNILINDDKFILLDWRQNFAGSKNLGDKYYDLAKFNHNLIFNHDIIYNNGFFINSSENGIICDLFRSHQLTLLQDTFLHTLKLRNYDVKKVKLLTSLIWLNMAPLHVYPLNKFLFYFGKYNLWNELS